MLSGVHDLIHADARLLRLVACLSLLALLASLPAYAQQGTPSFSTRIDGEIWIWSGSGMDWSSAYPIQTGDDATPLSVVEDHTVTGCSGSLALGAAPDLLRVQARLQSDPGPGCAQSSSQGVSRAQDTLRFWASPSNIGDPLRLDLDLDLSGSVGVELSDWPDADSYLVYTLDVRVMEVLQTYPDGSVEIGATLGDVEAHRGFDGAIVFQEIIDDASDALQLELSDAGGALVPEQRLVLRIHTERGAQIALRWELSAYISFDNRGQPDGGPQAAVVEVDFGDSLALAGAVVRDPSDESIVTDSGLTAASGLDYLALPEPGAAPGQGAVLIALLVLRRRAESARRRHFARATGSRESRGP